MHYQQVRSEPKAGEDTGFILDTGSLRDECAQHWDNDWKLLYVMFLVRLSFLCLNVSFVCHALDSPDEQTSTFHVLSRLVAWSEAVVVLYSLVRCLADVVLIYHLGQHSFVQIQVLVDNLTIASSFSLLEFVPAPAKLKYWWDHRRRLVAEFVTRPPVLFGRTLLDVTPEMVLRAAPGLLFVPAYVFLLVCVFTIQVLVPLALVLFPLLSIPAFMTKMAGLPDPHLLTQWSWGQWENFLGVLNQASKLWDPASIEKHSGLRVLSRMYSEDPTAQTDLHQDLSAEILRAALLELGRFRAFLFTNALGIGSISDVVAPQISRRIDIRSKSIRSRALTSDP